MFKKTLISKGGALTRDGPAANSFESVTDFCARITTHNTLHLHSSLMPRTSSFCMDGITKLEIAQQLKLLKGAADGQNPS